MLRGCNCPSVLDALYTSGPSNDADEAKLGVSYANGVGVSVWAPTAQNVELRIYSGDPLRVADTKANAMGCQYRYLEFHRHNSRVGSQVLSLPHVTNYNAQAKKVQRMEVTDPYAISFVHQWSPRAICEPVNDADTKPAGWDGHSSAGSGFA